MDKPKCWVKNVMYILTQQLGFTQIWVKTTQHCLVCMLPLGRHSQNALQQFLEF